MNTTEAASQAQVSTVTIRRWCRIGVINAAKIDGRWVIDTDSLNRHIGKTPVKPIVYSVDTMTAIGGNRWTAGDKDRVYINDWARFAGLETSHYKTGNISGASYRGETISNSQAYKLGSCIDKVWFDAADGKLHCRFGYGYGASRVATPEEVFEHVVEGIRAAIAAL